MSTTAIELSPEQQIKEAVTAATVDALLAGSWLKEEVMSILVREAEEQVMVRVMASLPPDLRTMASDVRLQLRTVVLRHFRNAVSPNRDLIDA